MSLSWHLAIESSGLGGSVALFQHDSHYRGDLHSQQVLPPNRGSVQTLVPAIELLLREAQIQVSQLSSLSVTCGPGSFTGLRVGLTTAKMLAWTARIPVIAVDTLEAIALRFAKASPARTGTAQNAKVDANSLPGEYRLVTAINAFRKQVFSSSWHISEGQLQCLSPSSVVDVHTWLADPWQAAMRKDVADSGELRFKELALWVSGGAIGTYAGLNTDQCQLAESDLWQPMAEQVGQLGLLAMAAGRSVTAEELGPNYIRSSAAEENAR